MQLSHLKTLVTAIQLRSISRAAAELHLTQPAVTKHIQALENHYGRPLLERTGREVRPTEEGRILYRYALEVLSVLAAAEAAVAEAGEMVRGQLRLGASTIPGQYVLPRLIGAFRRLYPLVDLHLEIADTERIAGQVAERKADAGVVGSPVRDGRLSSFPFLEDELVVIMPARHPLATREAVYARDLAGQPLIWREVGSGTRKTVEERLAGAGVDLGQGQGVIEVGSTEAVVAAVEAGLGLSVVSRRAALRSVAAGSVVARELADISLRRELYVIFPRQGASRPARAFVDFLRGPLAEETPGYVHAPDGGRGTG